MYSRKPKTESEFDRAFRTMRPGVERLSLAELYALFQRTIVELFCRGEDAETIRQLRHQADLLEKSLARKGVKPVEHSLKQRWGSVFQQKPMNGYEPRNKGQPRDPAAGPDMTAAPFESAPVDVAKRTGLVVSVARETVAWVEDEEDPADLFTDEGEMPALDDPDDAAARFLKQQGASI